MTDLRAAGARRIVRRKPYGTWLMAIIVVACFLKLAVGFATNPAMRWDLVGQFLFAPVVLSGLMTTLWVTIVITAFSAVVGLAVAVMRLSGNPVLKIVADFYLWIFRAIPALVWLLFWYFLAILVPKLSLGVPFGPTLFEGNTNEIIGRFGAAVLGLGLVEGAYMAEVIRGGLVSVNRGQAEAARALGMRPAKILWYIVLPQALKAIIPGFANQIIMMIKGTSLLLIIGVPELMTTVQDIYTANFQQIPLLVVACFWYLAICSVLSIVQGHLEARASKGAHR
ncbi:polar amino acid transport system permease protein [Neorhizobium galegae]|uniref:amino acid ABC transporter permease n=1 Tax=Neorhizobium galegae TaxID=399 RepID=UPI00277DC0A2|nr:amino acid ABC transporter permease [Neorhizobium galegae]MDQ0137710.1 polar amino acid transport system permease protein [Neorhizobium galegae]